MRSSSLAKRATELMGEPVHEVVTLWRRPPYTELLWLPAVAATVLAPSLWFVLPIILAVVAVEVTVTKKRFLAFASTRCELLIGGPVPVRGITAFDQNVPLHEIGVLSERGLTRMVRVGDRLFRTTRGLARRLNTELERHAQPKAETRS